MTLDPSIQTEDFKQELILLRTASPSGQDTTDRTVGRPPDAPAGSSARLEWIISELLPANFGSEVMTRRGAATRALWDSLVPTPLYEEVTLWVMAAWPDEALERVDTMVRTAIASADRVRRGEWTTERLIGFVRRAGRRGAHREVRQHMGQEVRIVSFDDALMELADAAQSAGTPTASLGGAIVAHLRSALGEHGYLATAAAAALLDRSCDIAVDHLDSVRARTVCAQRPQGLSGLELFAAARPTRNANKSNRIIEVFRDLPHQSAVSLSHLLLGTDRHPEASLLWRHASGMAPVDVPDEIVADWRGDLVALTPATLGFSDRRRRRLRDRSRRGDDLRHFFEQALGGELAGEHASMSI